MNINSIFTPFRGFGDFVRRNARRLPMIAELVAAVIAIADPGTPAWAKAILVAVVVYRE